MEEMLLYRTLKIITTDGIFYDYDNVIIDLLNMDDAFNENVDLINIKLQIVNILNEHYKENIFGFLQDSDLKIVSTISGRQLYYNKNVNFILKDIWNTELKPHINFKNKNVREFVPSIISLQSVKECTTDVMHNSPTIILTDELSEILEYLILENLKIDNKYIKNIKNIGVFLILKIEQIKRIDIQFLSSNINVDKYIIENINNISKYDLDLFLEKTIIKSKILTLTNYNKNKFKEMEKIKETERVPMALIPFYDLHKINLK